MRRYSARHGRCVCGWSLRLGLSAVVALAAALLAPVAQAQPSPEQRAAGLVAQVSSDEKFDLVGRGAAIAEVGKHHHEVHGQLAHMAWLGVHASLMTGTKDKIEAIIDWSWDRFSKTSGPHVLDRGDEADIDWNDDPAVTAMGTPASAS